MKHLTIVGLITALAIAFVAGRLSHPGPAAEAATPAATSGCGMGTAGGQPAIPGGCAMPDGAGGGCAMHMGQPGSCPPGCDRESNPQCASGCVEQAGQKPAAGSPAATVGRAIDPSLPVTPIKRLLDRPADYDGKTVVVKGTISRECGAGCWLRVRDETGEIHVDLAPARLKAPLREEGHAVTALGVVQHDRTGTSLRGKGLKIED